MEINWRIPQWFKDIEPIKLKKLQMFHVELIKSNSQINLVSVKSIPLIDQIYFADSILGLKKVLSKTKADKFIEIGSGNGFPGIVMAILAPERETTLTEVDPRRADFYKSIIDKLQLKNAKVSNIKLESMNEGSVQAWLAKDFASLTKLLMTGRKCFKPGAEFFILKGAEWALEMAAIPHQLYSAWDVSMMDEYTVPGEDQSRVVVLAKHH